jgi:cytochrome b
MTQFPLRSSEALPGPDVPPSLWDPVVRLTHWSLALVVLGNALVTRGGSPLHVALGWAGLAVLALRLIWGLIGPREARFSAFPPNPVAALRHLGQLARGRPETHPSHNPAGAVMAYALWACLAATTITGLVMTQGRTPMQVAADQAAVDSGDWSALVKDGDETAEDGALGDPMQVAADQAAVDSGDWSALVKDGDETAEDGALGELAEEVHEVTANLILLLAVLHVAGVVVESRALRRNLVAPMLSGLRSRRK